MKKIIIFILSIFLSFVVVNAQTPKKTGNKKKTQKVETKLIQSQDTVKMAANPLDSSKVSHGKEFSSPEMVKNIIGGYVSDSTLFLYVREGYEKLPMAQKQNLLHQFDTSLHLQKYMVYVNQQSRELWISANGNLRYLESWNNDSLQIDNYMPLELKRGGNNTWFSYLGGTFTGTKMYSEGSFNLRIGSFLYKDIIDAATSLNVGRLKSEGYSQWQMDVGISSRYYKPLELKGIRIAPYAGLGISWNITPLKIFELQLYAGGCVFVGPGSLDAGLQYGTQSKFSFTIGYTFRPGMLNTKKKK